MIGGLVPYPQYRESDVPWLGKIPAGWDVAPGRLLFSEKQIKNKGLVEKRVLSLSYGRIVVKPDEKLHGLVPESFETYQIVEPGDLIIRATDLQNDQTSLRIGFVRDRGIITSAYLCLEGRRPLRPEFGYLVLHAYDLKKILYGLGSGLRQNLSFKDFKYLPVVLPPREDQEAVVRFIRSAERRINFAVRAKRKLIALLNEQKQVIIDQTVAFGLDPNIQLIPSGVPWLGSIPAHWSPLQLRRFVSLVTSGSRGWARYYSDDGAVFLQSGNLGRSMSLNLSFIQHVRPPEGSEGTRTKVTKNDLLLCITGALTGNVVLVDMDLPNAFVNQHVALIRPKADKIFPRFLAYVLHSRVGQAQFRTSEYGGTKQGLGLGDVKSVVVALPPLREQEVLARHLDEVLAGLTAPIAQAQREIELIREYRTRLIADLVTGQLDVREAAEFLSDHVEGEELPPAPEAEDEGEELPEAVADHE